MDAEERLARMSLEERKGSPHVVLRDSVCHNLESGQRGTNFPVLASYLIDLEPEKIRGLKSELEQIRNKWDELSMVVLGPDGKIATVGEVDAVIPTHHDSYSGVPPHATIALDARNTTRNYVDTLLQACDEAIGKGCGFGKYRR